VSLAALSAGAALAFCQPSAQAAYTWNNVKIAGGGFVPGIVFSQAQQNLIYARTDVGGLYRWNQANSTWSPLLDWVGWSNWGYSGVASVAPDPTNANIVWAAVGGYSNSWDPNNGAILKSTDQGTTWSTTPMPFKIGGNMPGRACGERLAVDPNNDNILFYGADNGNGLWKSTNGGSTWSQVTSFPDLGSYEADPTDQYNYQNIPQGIYWIKYDKRSGTPGTASQTIYAGVADNVGSNIYVSTNGGTTWSAVPGQPTGFLPHQAALDTVNGILYIAYSNTGGPYDGASGDVWKYNTGTGAWTLISPHPSTDTNNDYYGYSGVSVDAQNPNVVMVTGYSSWWPDTFIFRSTNQGASWTNIWSWTTYPSMSYKCVYPMDITAAPWLKWPTQTHCTSGGRPGPVENPKLGWMTEALAIDPFNSNRFMYGTGATLFGSNNLTNWDVSSTSQINLSCMAQGIEETAVNDLASPPSGPQLYSAVADVTGFAHTDVTKVPTTMYPTIRGSKQIDFAQNTPSTLVSADTPDVANNCYNGLAVSTTSGSSWTVTGALPSSSITGAGTVCISASGSRVIWAPTGTGVGVYSSTNASNKSPTWTTCTGIPAGAIVRSDRVNASKFYGFSGGTFYLSTTGTSFAAMAATGLPASGNFKALPGVEGDIWLVNNDPSTGGIWHSTNSGSSFTKLTNVTCAQSIGFGLHATGQTYPAIYIQGTVSGVTGFFRSIDGGSTWTQINDSAHQWYASGNVITGDPRIYGRVYIGTNGRGIIYGDGS
jgi:hypothetical protein